ncbi:MAG: EAL domain-containing protein [Solirubrobacterales bacterium]
MRSYPQAEAPSIDQVTLLPDRRRLLELLAEALQSSGGSVAVLLVDIDGFRKINRDRGHDIGDELLFSSGRRIRSAVGADDIVARAGGDELAVVCTELSEPGELADLGKRILAAFDDPFALGEGEFDVTVSVGVAVADDPGTPPEGLIAEAEAALELNPHGIRRFEIFDAELRERLRGRSELGRELALALGAGDVKLVFQPIVDIASGRIASVEALARWEHRSRGWVSPEVFVELANEVGLGGELRSYLLERAGTEFAAIAREDPTRRVSLAFNISAADLGAESLIAGFEELVRRSGVEPGRIVVEISESALTGAPDDYIERVTVLRALGVKIALDDFGTASTSIAQLRSLPIDQIKLDRSFVEGLGSASPDAALAAGVLPIARALGMEVVAEGIETDQHLAHLFALGYRLGQGYRFAPPASAEDVASLIARGPLASARMPASDAAAASRESFRRALLAGDAKHAAAVVDAALRAGIGPMTIQSEVIGRALHWIDSEWEAGRLRAADEHLAAAICERELAAVLESAERSGRRVGPRILIAAVGGEVGRGELASAAEALEAAGYETVSLGEHVGDDELERAIGAHHPGAICLNVPHERGRAALRETVSRLGAVSEPPLVLIRGGEEEDAPGAGTIPITSTEDAIEVLASELAGSESA